MVKASGAVAAGHGATAAAAAEVLRAGGNAFDATLAGLLAACVAEPLLASLGGGGFLLAQPAEGEARLYDFFSQTPRRKRPEAELDFYPIITDFGTATQEFHIGMASTAVPGVVRGLFAAHRDLGRMPMARLVEPAAALARDGVRVSRFQAYVAHILGSIVGSGPAVRAIYHTGRDGGLIQEGDHFHLPELADALEALAAEGDRLFYDGEMGAMLVAACRDHGGHLTPADLANYQVLQRPPIRVAFGDAEVLMNPPPSSGGLLIAVALKLLDGAGFAADGPGSRRHLTTLARCMAETNRARLESRLHEADDHDRAGHALLDPDFLAQYRARVAPAPAFNRGTTHISVIDGEGNAAALSVSNGEGSGYVIPGTGIMVNNMLGEEDINPHGFHQWPEDARISSMMAPTLMRRDRTLRALGSGGSNRIRSAILQVLVNLVGFDMAPEAAVAAPRLHLEGALMNLEEGYPQEAQDAVLAAHPEHRLWPQGNLFFGGVHVAEVTDGHPAGAGDPRREGVALMVE